MFGTHLVEVNIVLADPMLRQQLGDSVGGTDAHDSRGNTNNRSTNELAENGETQLLGDRTPGEQDGGSTIGNLGRVSSVRKAVFGERWLQLGQGLGSNAVPDAVILAYNNLGLVLRFGIYELDRYGNDLVVEFSLFLSGGGLDEGLGSEFVLHFTSDTEVVGDVLRGNPHGKKTLLGFGHGKNFL